MTTSMTTSTDEDLEQPYWHLLDPPAPGLWRTLAAAPSSIRPLLSAVRRSAPGSAAAAAGLQLLSGAASAIMLIAVSRLFAQLLAPGTHLGRLLPSLVVVGALGLVRGAADAGVSALHAVVGPAVLRTAQEDFCRATLNVELAALDESAFHDRLHRARDFGLQHLQQGTDSLLQLAGALSAVAGAAAALGVLHPLLLAVFPLAVLPAAWGVLRAARLGHRNLARTISLTRRQWMIAELLTQRSSAAEIRANRAQPFVLGEYLAVAEKLREQAVRLGWTQTRARTVGRLLSGLGLAGTYLCLAVLTASGWLAPAAAGTAVIAIRSASTALATVLLAAGQLLEHGLYIADLRDFTAAAEARTPPAGGLPVRPPREIVVDAVGFHYPGAPAGDDALRGISLTVRSGQTIALVGENGSGKTTLAKLIAGLYRPTTGTIAWDGTDTARLDHEALADHIMIMQQEPVRWPHDARTNIRIGRHDRTDPHDEALLRAAREAHADETIADLPQGWHTLLSKYFQGGRELSGGQWQRLAVARGLFRDAPLLIWDEPTAPLDAASEFAVYESLRTLAADRIVILITHRLPSIRHADQIFLLHDGEIAEHGTHEELLAAGGRYAFALELQERMRNPPCSLQETAAAAPSSRFTHPH